MIELRKYQTRAMEDLLEWFRNNQEGHCIVSACVGSGKSVMLAWLCQHAITQWPETRIIMLVPNKELLEQNHGKLVSIWPEAPVGIMSASVGKKQLGHAITIATIGSLYKHAAKVGHIDLLIVDEAHAIPGGEEGMYRKFIADMHKYCPAMRVIGATGTPYRGNGVWLTAVDDAIFTDIAAHVTMDELLEAGYLTPLTTQPTATRMDATGVRTIGGDYVVSELANAIDRPALVSAACSEAARLAADRSKWLVYCVTVAHAEHVKDELQNRLGIDSEIVTGETPKAIRAERIERFRAGQVRALVSVAVLTTGFDVPDVDCIVLLRNTRSPVLYVQIMGRGLRVAEGKADCLVLDFTDTVENLGPVNRVRGHEQRRKSVTEAPVKVCDECGSLNPIAATECKLCGAAFEVIANDSHKTTVSHAQIIDNGQPYIVRHQVTEVTYGLHRKLGKPDSLMVSYWSGIKRVAREWVCLDHEGYARTRAESWWSRRAPRLRNDGQAFVPGGTTQALEWIKSGYELEIPSYVNVNESGKYPEIVGYAWPDSQLKEAA